MTTLQQLREKASSDPNTYWGEIAKDIDWFTPYNRVLNDDNPPYYTWFNGGTTNACYNAVDRHVKNGHGDKTAIIYDSPVTDTQSKISYNALQDEVSKVAGWLVSKGIKKGDVVLIYMPMIPQAAMAILACARIGAIHNVVFGGFAAKELAKRIDASSPRAVITASCGIEPSRIIPYQEILEEGFDISAHSIDNILIVDRPQHAWNKKDNRDCIWADVIPNQTPADVVPVESEHPLYILYTSGSTGQPKGVLRDTGGYITALKWSMKNIYNVTPDQVYWSASDVGWVVGHSYIVYGPLLHGATTVFYEGKPIGTPDAGAFWRVIEDHNISCLFTAPTAIRAIKREDPNGALVNDYNLSKLDSIFLAGERCDPDTLLWLEKISGKPVIDHWWQTETGWSIAANCLGIEQLPTKAGSPTMAVPGYQVQVLGEDHQPLPAGEMGEICIKLPLPPGCLKTLWQDDSRFEDSYMNDFPGYYKTGDAGIIDADGYIHVMSRTDDIINIAGHRLSTGAMEEVLAEHQSISECAVVAKQDPLKGHMPVGFVVVKSGFDGTDEDLEKELKSVIRESIGAIAHMQSIHRVEFLPKTRSGKVLRATLRKIVDGEPYETPPTIERLDVLDNIKAMLDNKN